MLQLSKLKNRRGFTLVEAVVSILILGIALGIMLIVFMMSRMSVAMAKHRIEAMNHARAAMEQLINNRTASLTLPDGDIKCLGGSYSRVITGTGTGIIQIVVTISWNEPSMGSSHPVSEQLVTLVAE